MKTPPPDAWNAPFVLFEDARPGGVDARLFVRPRRVVTAHSMAEVEPALQAVRAGLAEGLYAAGWMNYEAGLAFEPRLAARAPALGAAPLLWFGLFESDGRISRSDLHRALPDGAGAYVSPPRPRITRADYGAAFDRVKAYLEAGDVYQINLSYRADLKIGGHPLAAYARLRESGQGGWSAAAHDGASWFLSTSPELFFKLANGAIEAKPMKGTARRGRDAAEDQRAIEDLRADPKQCAENVMIVDLLRNDISKLAKRGSVHVPALLSVETYPTLHTLTSTVRAEIEPHYDAIDVLRALFPCGSITGAPKIRAMEIIAELEPDRRGAYTGSLGWIAPDGAAEFNVAIRTIAIRNGRAEIGLGSAVVMDSTCDDEWAECRAKGAFVTAHAPGFELLETMRTGPGGVERLDLHMQRLKRSAEALGFAFEEAAIRAALAQAGEADAPCVLRFRLSANGAFAIDTEPLRVFPAGGAQAALAPRPVRGDDFRLLHKTSLRDFYDRARAGCGGDEVVFFDEAGFLTEGSFTNLFVARGGVLLTPPLSRGLLPGVLRAELIADGRAIEADLRAEDLKHRFLLGNSVRGLTPAQLLPNALAQAS
ncbi:MAG TPA: aminodeoxychorismate synthase component I [Terricaulis sp.]|nr:aminodeoxychorismate synthase component I [Terricaulis sp.]